MTPLRCKACNTDAVWVQTTRTVDEEARGRAALDEGGRVTWRDVPGGPARLIDPGTAVAFGVACAWCGLVLWEWDGPPPPHPTACEEIAGELRRIAGELASWRPPVEHVRELWNLAQRIDGGAGAPDPIPAGVRAVLDALRRS